MSDTVSTGHGFDIRRHKLTGDVHLLLLNTDGQVLFGHRQNTGFQDGVWNCQRAISKPVNQLCRHSSGRPRRRSASPLRQKMSSSPTSSQARLVVAGPLFFFIVRQWDGTPANREPEKCSEVAWFPIDALPDPLIGYCRMALDYIAAGESFSVYGW